jgi:hypothetical protein
MFIKPGKIFPILSSADPNLKRDMVSEIYPETLTGPLASLQGELYWHYFDLCYFHQIAYKDINDKLTKLDQEYAAFQEKNNSNLTNPSLHYEEQEAYYSKMQAYFMDNDLALHRAKRFADEYSIIGLWAMTERFLGNVYAHIISAKTSEPKESVHRPYRWADFNSKFAELGVDLSTINGFIDANECRALNNSIKHTQMIDVKLAEFPFFQNKVDEQFQCIELEMQRYASGIYNFCSGLIAAGTTVILKI